MSIQLLKTHKTFAGLTQFWEHDSKETKTKMKFSTYIPVGKVEGCLIWLSGLTCTEENFISKACSQRYLVRHNLMVICPDTSPRGLNLPGEHDSSEFGSGASFYVDATTDAYKTNYRMESYITEELHSLIQENFAISKNRISISGHSMGGHGALVMGLKYPEKFRSVSALAPVTNPTKSDWGQKAFAGYLGTDKSTWDSYDATELVNSGKKTKNPILIDQGTRDEFLETQLHPESFTTACKENSQDVIFNYREGYDHSYYFVATAIGSHIKHHAHFLTK